ncbi:MAG: helix-turn-helix domain-containing protein, partial [Eggerthellaceae bacterium]|nr:helix-turn-helix domain-containing protein [Eggerthellaceae bacterium]
HRHLSLKLTTMIARRSLGLSQQLFHTTPKSIRGKLLSYLSHESERAESNEFDIPFNRQQLANYLGVDRSAMSNEISKMRDDGILETKRSHFKLNERAFQ